MTLVLLRRNDDGKVGFLSENEFCESLLVDRGEQDAARGTRHEVT
jgi:hypothetical protein